VNPRKSVVKKVCFYLKRPRAGGRKSEFDELPWNRVIPAEHGLYICVTYPRKIQSQDRLEPVTITAYQGEQSKSRTIQPRIGLPWVRTDNEYLIVRVTASQLAAWGMLPPQDQKTFLSACCFGPRDERDNPSGAEGFQREMGRLFSGAIRLVPARQGAQPPKEDRAYDPKTDKFPPTAEYIRMGGGLRVIAESGGKKAFGVYQQKATWIYVASHGSAGKLFGLTPLNDNLGEEPPELDPNTQKIEWRQAKVAVLAACDILNQSPCVEGATQEFRSTTSTLAKWLEKGPEIILGYNGRSPHDNYRCDFRDEDGKIRKTVNVTNQSEATVRKFCDNYRRDRKRDIVSAWLRANAAMYKRIIEGEEITIGPCANAVGTRRKGPGQYEYWFLELDEDSGKLVPKMLSIRIR
jgi:hypothetical protein